MIDIKLIREQRELVRQNIKKKFQDEKLPLVDEIYELDKKFRNAKKEADDVVKEAENRIISMIDEHEITKKAYEQKNQIMEAANENSRQITQGAKEYADNILADLEGKLEKVLKEISQDRRELK